ASEDNRALKLVNGKTKEFDILQIFQDVDLLIIFASPLEGKMLDKKAAYGSQKREAPGKRGYRRRKAPARRPTMIDVANEARVSQTTVSLVLNHADGARLSAETRERVVKAAARLGYQQVRRGFAPGSAAAASIGFICDEISTDPWTAIGLDGVREKAWERGVTVMVMTTRGDADMESAALAQLT